MTAGPSPRRVSWWARLSLTFKMVVATTLVGAVVWTGVYLVEASAMERLFRKQLQTQLDLLNVESRLRFDRHIKAFHTLLKLFPSLHRFEHYLNDARWQRGEPRLFQQPPPWFPPRSALRHLVHPRYALLIGPDGRVQEVYHSWESEVPEPLLEPHALLRETSHDQTRMTRIGGRPFLVASQAIADEEGRPRATVMLATPIDNEFLMASQELGATGEVTALITHDSPARVIASSDPGRVEPGDSVAVLKGRFMIAANPHFDYGASDLQLRLATLVPLQKMEAQVDTLLGVERRENLFAAGVFILVASLLMYLVTRRIERVGRRIRAFSDQVSGQQTPGETRPGGDQLIQLEEEFQRLTEEVEEAREAMGRQADLLREEKEEQLALNRRLQDAHNQLLQSEKMASIGQLAAGVAHEINNPIGYVGSNLASLREYVDDLLRLLEAYRSAAEGKAGALEQARALEREVELDFLRQDLADLLSESGEGLERVKQIIQDLKDFSRADRSEEWAETDLREGLESTLNIVWNELKYKAEVEKVYGELPPVKCLPSQLNQVFMNLLVNAGQAIGERGTITLRTGRSGPGWVYVEVADSGSGIPEAERGRIFDPFYTTKPVGQGTGLGLSLAYSIVEKHHGRIEVESAEGAGTTFRIHLPVDPEVVAAAEEE